MMLRAYYVQKHLSPAIFKGLRTFNVVLSNFKKFEWERRWGGTGRSRRGGIVIWIYYMRKESVFKGKITLYYQEFDMSNKQD